MLLESRFAEVFEVRLLKTNVRASNCEKGRCDVVMMFAFLRFLWQLCVRLVFFRPDVVYHYATATRLGWLGRDLWCIHISRRCGAKVVVHMRAGHFILNYRDMARWERFLIGRGFRRSNLVLWQSRGLLEAASSCLPRGNARWIYNMVDTGKFANDDVTACDRDAILFLGHLSYSKGYCDLLEAMPKVIQAFPNARFYFAGTKIRTERNVLHNQLTGARLQPFDPEVCYDRYVRGRMEDHYVYLGVLGEAEKIAWLKRSNMLVLPSYSEGFSMAVLEALAVGKPVVCAPVGALGEIVRDGENGFLVQPGDAEGLAEAIKAILADSPMRDRMAATNYHYARSHFSRELIVGRLIDYMQEVASLKSQGSHLCRPDFDQS